MYEIVFDNGNGIQARVGTTRLLRTAKARLAFLVESRRDEGIGTEYISPTKVELYHKSLGTMYYTIEKVER